MADKCGGVALSLGSEAWQEQILKTAHHYYDLEQTRLLITGGDGNQWVRRTFQRFDLPQKFVLDISQRGYSSELGSLGAIEGNVDKMVIHRMKGRGCCWQWRGARTMLALCQQKETLKNLAFQCLPLEKTRTAETPREATVGSKRVLVCTHARF